MAVILALDPGLKRVGLAISDPLGTLASPLCALRRKPHGAFLEALEAIIAERAPTALVVGLPARSDGRLGKEAQAALSLAFELRAKFGLPVETVDESYTTLEAREILFRNGVPDGPRLLAKIDQCAAGLILERYLAKLPNMTLPLE
ncbi:MAG: Holliday junction resolvase RuvX [Deltaproteobacteria bacterium]|jgi:putative Holliday junction resolvase|nr:Holliday junction resolvase RuvX [Deltaproteobacteria bacterium]